MTDLRELYQEVIIDHGKNPRNFGCLQNATHQKEGFNPLCGDKIKMTLLEKSGKIEKIKFEGSGCAISMASASLLTELLCHKTPEEFEALFQHFHHMMMSGEPDDSLEKLTILSGVAEFPARVKCATLAWHTCKAALQKDKNKITTEVE